MRSLLFTTLVLTRPRSANSLVVAGGGSRVSASRRHLTRLPAMCTHAPSAADTAPPERGVSAPRLFSSSAAAATTELKLLNSLTQQVEPFVPLDPRLVKWYVCGPTVYDAAHVGHARNYVAFDIVRRVLMDYFGFDVLYVENITDIDDKIILRTHLNHLIKMVAAVKDQRAEAPSADELTAALAAAEAALALPKPGLSDLLQAQSGLAAAVIASGLNSDGATAACDVQTAFLELTTAYECDFFEDMSRLNVLPPDAITRVSDYVPEIIAYIETIMGNGFCYEANGSVYFDTAAFSGDPTKTYGKLDPSKVAAGAAAVGADASDWTEGKSVAELLAEGEGALSVRLPLHGFLLALSTTLSPPLSSHVLLHSLSPLLSTSHRPTRNPPHSRRTPRARRRTPPTSSCGRPPRRGSPCGRLRGVSAAQGGTSNAQQWHPTSWEIGSI